MVGVVSVCRKGVIRMESKSREVQECCRVVGGIQGSELKWNWCCQIADNNCCLSRPRPLTLAPLDFAGFEADATTAQGQQQQESPDHISLNPNPSATTYSCYLFCLFPCYGD